MADGSPRLADDVLPQLPYSQWTLTHPHPIEHQVGFQPVLVGHSAEATIAFAR